MKCTSKSYTYAPQRLLLLVLVGSYFYCGGMSAAFCQGFSGSLTGVVTDPTGAVVSRADVVLTDVNKGYTYTSVSDAQGRYVIRSLNPGDYRLKVKAQGFEEYALTGIVITLNENTSSNVELQVGSTTTTVDVQSGSPLLQTEDATLGATIDRKQINDLPLVGRSVLSLAFLAPGINQAQGSTLSPTGDTEGNALNFVSNGQRNATAALYVDGVVTSQGDPNPGVLRPLYFPTPDATQEFRVQQGIFRADSGFSGGTVINIVTRSGTNSFHGTAYDFDENNSFNANNFFNNLNGTRNPPANTSIFGGAVGGPIKKNKTFFFFVYNGTLSRSSSTVSAGVPTLQERAGNFGDICTSGFDSAGLCSTAGQQLWDPYTAISTSGGPVAQNFIPYNNLATYTSPGPPSVENSTVTLPAGPGNLIDPVGAKIVQSAFPAPNVANGNLFNNYFATTVGHNLENEFDLRIDQRFSQKDNLIGKFSYEFGNSNAAGCFNSIFDPCSNGPNTGKTYQVVMNYSRAISDHTLVQLQGGLISNLGISPGVASQYPGFDPVTTLGLPGYIDSAGYKATPYITYSGYNLGQIGGKPYQVYNIGFQTWQVGGSVDMVRGRHDIKIGADYRLIRQNYFQPGVPAGDFAFTNSQTAQSQNNSGSGGNSLASLLVGGPLNGGDNYQESTQINSHNPDYDVYVQDTWHATRNLTIDAGLRYEIQVPETESSNRIAWFDPNTPSPLAGIVPGFTSLKGQVDFASSLSGPRTPFDTNFSNIAPRIGLAYSANSVTVVRAGYGIFYLSSIGTAGGVTSGNSSPWESYTGAQTYTYDGNPTYDGATPYSRLANPFPGGVLAPVGNSPTPLAFIGQSASLPIRSVNKTPYQQTWTLGAERQLPAQTLLNVYYVGTRGTHLYDAAAGSLDHLPISADSLSPAALGTIANTYVPNPYYNAVTPPQGCAGYNLVCQPTVSEVQLMLPYPQYNGVSTTNTPVGYSIYHALQAQLQKRLTFGLTGQLSYTWAKSIDNSSVPSGGAAYLAGGSNPAAADPNNLRLEKSISGFDVPQNLTFAYAYALPYGRGKRFGEHANYLLDAVLGGWNTTGVWAFQSGFPINLYQNNGSPIPTYGTIRPTLTGVLKKNPAWNSKNGQAGLNEYFANPTVVTATPSYTLGNAPRFTSSVRAPGINTATLGVFKDFSLSRLTEAARFELRVEAFNAFNHPQFTAPATGVDGGNFGQVTGQANLPRTVQLGGKIYF